MTGDHWWDSADSVGGDSVAARFSLWWEDGGDCGGRAGGPGNGGGLVLKREREQSITCNTAEQPYLETTKY